MLNLCESGDPLPIVVEGSITHVTQFRANPAVKGRGGKGARGRKGRSRNPSLVLKERLEYLVGGEA